jgi:methionyl-tRNA formyltransferase
VNESVSRMPFMRISIVCSSDSHPVWSSLVAWKEEKEAGFIVELVTKISELSGGDLLFLVSCGEVVSKKTRDAYATTLVIHASNLPAGRGWSPLVWQILEGKNRIAVTLLEAEDAVDTGRIWSQVWLDFDGTELFDEINAKLFSAELELMNYAVAQFKNVLPAAQSFEGVSYYRKRTPEDSRIDPYKTFADQFDLLRVSDTLRYPAFFEFRGQRYEISLRKTFQP